MSSAELVAKVGELRDRGLRPKEIARVLGLRPSEVAPLVRELAQTRTPVEAQAPLVSAWLSIGWSGGLSWQGHPDWDDQASGEGDGLPLVVAVVAREDRHGKLSACTYLVDTFCLGVKNVIGPRTLPANELREFLAGAYRGHEGEYQPASIELVQHLVLGAVEYARTLGFEPHPDFTAGRRHLGAWDGASDVTFGRRGKPLFVQGPDDDVAAVMSTLRRTVGQGNFDYVLVG